MTAPNERSSVSRRSLVRSAAWAVPTSITAASAPVLAASLRKDPGLNGWVSNSYRAGTCGFRNSSIEVTSIATAATPDGAPFGLYLYDTEDVVTATNASITYWVLGNHATTGTTAITWSSASGHSTCWSYQGRVGTAQKPDGLIYTGYRWTYTCAIDPHATTVGNDGVARVMLGNFHVISNTFAQPAGSCGKLNFWTERAITLDGIAHTFQRRAGTDGTYTSAGRARSSRSVSESAGDELRTAVN